MVSAPVMTSSKLMTAAKRGCSIKNFENMARLFYNVYFYIFDDLVHAVTHDALACFKALIYELPPAVHATEGYVPAFRDVVVVEYKHIGGIFVIRECGAWYDHFFNPLFVSKINRNCIVWQQPRL